jgi:hypothetical protein
MQKGEVEVTECISQSLGDKIGASIVHLGGQGAHRYIDLSRFWGPGRP